MSEGDSRGRGEAGRGDRPWYRGPESFIAIAALVVSVSAVVVGLPATGSRWSTSETSEFLPRQAGLVPLASGRTYTWRTGCTRPTGR